MFDQGKIRIFTRDLAKLLAINIQKAFPDKEDLKVKALKVLKILEDNVENENLDFIKDVQDLLREILTLIFQYVLKKSPPTNLLYYKGVMIQISQGSQIDVGCIEYRKMLLLFTAIATVFAYLRTQRQELLKIISELQNIVLTSDPNSKSDKFGNAFLAKMATLLFMMNQENVDQVLPQVFSILNTLKS